MVCHMLLTAATSHKVLALMARKVEEHHQAASGHSQKQDANANPVPVCVEVK
jgi:hypothetical protein